MPLVLYNHYYEKEAAIKLLNSMKYYNKNTLQPFKSNEEIQSNIGIIPYIRIYEEKMNEDYLIDKMKIIRGILEKRGNEAIDAYQELTSPDENNFLYPLKNMFDRTDSGIGNLIAELTIPMKKDEFEHYLEIYNQIYQYGEINY